MKPLHSGARGPCCRGFSLVELAISLTIAAVLAASGFKWAGYLRQRSDLDQAEAVAEAARTALLSFAASHHRLPRPDVDGDGLETSAGEAVGWLPIVTLGMSDRTSTGDLPKRPRYAVYRAASVDLTSPAASSDTGLRQNFIVALQTAATAPATTAGPRVVLAKEDCVRAAMNVAFAVFVPLVPDEHRPDSAETCFVAGVQVSSEQPGSLIGALWETP